MPGPYASGEFAESPDPDHVQAAQGDPTVPSEVPTPPPSLKAFEIKTQSLKYKLAQILEVIVLSFP